MKFSLKTLGRGASKISSFLVAGILLVVCGGAYSHSCSKSHRANETKASKTSVNAVMIESVHFKELNGAEVYNASGIVSLADSRFLFCDNRTNDALFELRLTSEGQQQGALIRRPLLGLAPDAIDDLEDMTMVEEAGQRYLFVTTSMHTRQKKTGLIVPPSGILRVSVQSDDSLRAENMPGFREWLINAYPQLAASAQKVPDDEGLNLEGLAWDQSRRALLFGVRTPVPKGRPLILPVKVKDLAGSWETGNLEAQPPIQLSLEAVVGEQGIRGLSYDPQRNVFLILTGKSTSDSKSPFALYEWNGQADAAPRRVSVGFAKAMKPEGLTRGSIGGKTALVIVDDGGGFQVIWDEKGLSFGAKPESELK